jgi:hypothetical protein
MQKLTKFDRLNILKRHGLNVLSYTFLKRGSDRNIILNTIMSYTTNISVRTQNPLGDSDVFYPKSINISPRDSLKNISEWINKYDILISESVNPELCNLCGNIALLKDKIIIETVSGAGTLDRITRENKLENHLIVNQFNYQKLIKDLCLNKIIGKSLSLPIRNIIIEFSIYNKPVGILNEEYLVWEFINY